MRRKIIIYALVTLGVILLVYLLMKYYKMRMAKKNEVRGYDTSCNPVPPYEGTSYPSTGMETTSSDACSSILKTGCQGEAVEELTKNMKMALDMTDPSVYGAGYTITSYFSNQVAYDLEEMIGSPMIKVADINNFLAYYMDYQYNGNKYVI